MENKAFLQGGNSNSLFHENREKRFVKKSQSLSVILTQLPFLAHFRALEEREKKKRRSWTFKRASKRSQRGLSLSLLLLRAGHSKKFLKSGAFFMSVKIAGRPSIPLLNCILEKEEGGGRKNSLLQRRNLCPKCFQDGDPPPPFLCHPPFACFFSTVSLCFTGE